MLSTHAQEKMGAIKANVFEVVGGIGGENILSSLLRLLASHSTIAQHNPISSSNHLTQKTRKTVVNLTVCIGDLDNLNLVRVLGLS